MHYKSGLIVVAVLSLVACSHKNTLTEINPEEASKAIQTAAISAEKTMNRKQHTSGNIYKLCMEKHYVKELNTKDCQTLYKTMVTAINKQPGYSHVNLNDLTDQTMYLSIKNDYSNDVFNTLPEY